MIKRAFFIPGLLFFTMVVFSCEQVKPNSDTTNTATKIKPEMQTGDIIFQSSTSGQSAAIQLATKSKYSHVGIVIIENGDTSVMEAVQPVKITPLKKWVKFGSTDHYVVKRLKTTDASYTKGVEDLISYGKTHLGKKYDIKFHWSDKKMYCSELVYKCYENGLGIELCKKRALKDFDLSHPIVKKKMEERYHGNIPLDEPMVSPGDIFNSDLLVETYRYL